tara:strand:- start:2525 stop:2638 length:114 start_codon:yes stop_codon:yes gene_type:complete
MGATWRWITASSPSMSSTANSFCLSLSRAHSAVPACT